MSSLYERALDALEAAWRVYAMTEALIDSGKREDSRELTFDHIQQSRVAAWALVYEANVVVEAARIGSLRPHGPLAEAREALAVASSLAFVPSPAIRAATYAVRDSLREIVEALRKGPQ